MWDKQNSLAPNNSLDSTEFCTNTTSVDKLLYKLTEKQTCSWNWGYLQSNSQSVEIRHHTSKYTMPVFWFLLHPKIPEKKSRNMMTWQSDNCSEAKEGLNEIKQDVFFFTSVSIRLCVECLHCLLGPMDQSGTHFDSLNSNTEQIMTLWYSYMSEKKFWEILEQMKVESRINTR